MRPAIWFFTDLTEGCWEGNTVTMVAIQLAYYMGFSEVYLLGVDHSYQFNGTPHAEQLSTGDDPNHFAPNYFGKGFRWHLPDLEGSELAYRVANHIFKMKAGGSVTRRSTASSRCFRRWRITRCSIDLRLRMPPDLLMTKPQ